MIYFAQKLWLYVMIWLPRTTDNSTHFAQSLEIRGIESRLYLGNVAITEGRPTQWIMRKRRRTQTATIQLN